MRGAMPSEVSVLLLMGKTAIDKKSYLRQVPSIDLDMTFVICNMQMAVFSQS